MKTLVSIFLIIIFQTTGTSFAQRSKINQQILGTWVFDVASDSIATIDTTPVSDYALRKESLVIDKMTIRENDVTLYAMANQKKNRIQQFKGSWVIDQNDDLIITLPKKIHINHYKIISITNRNLVLEETEILSNGNVLKNSWFYKKE